MTGGTINISGEVGKQSFFELKTTNLNGEENEYQLQMTLTEVIKAADN